MPNPAVPLAVATVGSAAIQSRGAKKAADVQSQASRESQQLQREVYQQQREDIEPYRQAGIAAQNELMKLLGIGGDATSPEYGMLTRGFTPEQMQMDPGYAFRLAEGEKALERMQSARGQLLGGGAIRAGVRYGQEMGSQEYMNAFNRAQAQLGTRLGVTGSLFGAGQAGTQQVTEAAGRMGANVGNLMMEGGRARASGYLGQANALAGALGQGAGFYGLYKGGYFG
jgi:hypothetical protein